MMQGGKWKLASFCLPWIMGPRFAYDWHNVRLGSIPAGPTGSQGQELFQACGVQAGYAAVNRYW